MLAAFALLAQLPFNMLSADLPQNQLCMPRSSGQRLFSASLAIGISLFFLVQLHHDFLRTVLPATSTVERIMLLSFHTKKDAPIIIQDNALNEARNEARTVAPTSPKPIKINAQVSTISKNNTEANAATELVNVFPETSSTTTATKPVDQLSGAARYKYDSASVRQAYEASKSDIQKLAEKSGASLEAPKASKHDRFQQAANRAAKPDCLRQGGSILSLFVVAYQVATDHCK